MIKALIALLFTAVIAMFVRGVIAMIGKEVNTMMKDEGKPEGRSQGKAGPAPGSNSVLQKCPVCGTYFPPSQLQHGQFCSEACAAKAKT
jgi:hypothetical protein